MFPLVLVGYYSDRGLMYAALVRAGLSTDLRRVLRPFLEELQIPRCPFINLPDRTEGRWGDGLTALKLQACR